MTFTIITHTFHYKEDNAVYAYGPYIREMNVWASHVDKVIVVAPKGKNKISKIHSSYTRDIARIYTVPFVSLTSVFKGIHAIMVAPIIGIQIFRGMQRADHIHLRCPGNIGLVGCLVQILFPKKPKTAKYAGNWDPMAKQPRSYRFQKWLLSNTFLTRNMKVLVYGEWPNQSQNILPFFTATYPENKIPGAIRKHLFETFRFLFVGSLSPGKKPIYAVQLVEKLQKNGISCRLDIYGDGAERLSIERYVEKHQLEGFVTLHGNQSPETVETAYKSSELLILPSKSEGWPKVIAEAMFWGVIPIATEVSCVPWMLGYGSRGIVLNLEIEKDYRNIKLLLQNKENLQQLTINAQKWSHRYTLDYFESEIKSLLQ